MIRTNWKKLIFISTLLLLLFALYTDSRNYKNIKVSEKNQLNNTEAINEKNQKSNSSVQTSEQFKEKDRINYSNDDENY